MSNLPPMQTTKIIPGESVDDFVKRVDAESVIYADLVEKYLISQDPWPFKVMRIVSNLFKRNK